MISISLVTYNHERYIAAAIESMLAQSHADFELIIVDDGSTDATPGIIKKYTDPRIVSIRQPNGGPSTATNTALNRATGDYIALMTGDDVSKPHRLASQLREYQRGPRRMLFSACDFIDDAGQPLKSEHYMSHSFEVSPRSQAATYRRLFDGNFINAVTGFTERAVFDAVGRYDPMMYGLQDFHMWMRMSKRFPIAFHDEPLLSYRIRAGQGNLSAPSRATWIRHDNESALIYREFFDDVDESLFREAFAGELRRPDLNGPWATLCEQAFLYLTSPRPELILIGMERFQQLFRQPEAAELLASTFDYPLARFVSFVKSCDTWNRYAGQESTLYVDTGDGFHDGQSLRTFARHEDRFAVSFDVRAFTGIQRLRWDPVEGRFATIALERAVWCDTLGVEHVIDAKDLKANGRPTAPGNYEFETLDPWIELPVGKDAVRLDLHGRWQIPSAEQALSQVRGWHSPADEWRWAEERRAAEAMRQELAELKQREERRLLKRIARATKRGMDRCRAMAKSFA